MSGTLNTDSPSVPPKLIVSRPVDEVVNKARRTRRRRTHPLSNPRTKEQGRSSSSEWTDVDDSPPRRNSRKRSSRRHDKGRQLSHNSQIGLRSNNEGHLFRFFPNLSRISEATESIASSRPGSRGSDQRRYRDKSSSTRSRYGEGASSVYERPTKHRTGGIKRRGEGQSKSNPSMLSVVSGVTGSSSGSSSTLTQRSYYRRNSHTDGSPHDSPRRSESEFYPDMTSQTRITTPSVFDYMEESNDDGQDRHSVASSSSSHYVPSDAGSSEAPGTPSSRSTFPSPTTTRSQSVSELRRKYDGQNGNGTTSIRSSSRSPDAPLRGLRKQPSVGSVPEDEEMPSAAAVASEIGYDPRQRPSSRSSQASKRGSDRLQYQEEMMRQHMAYTQQQQPHYVEPVYGQHRSYSNSSAHSNHSLHHHQMAMQQYQWPSHGVPPAAPHPPEAMNGHISPNGPPAAPEAPDLTQRTLTGYEKLALELSTESSIKPLYRKFEYLNHRILLHLQDELCELEEQLRTLDEMIAQMDPGTPDGTKAPASRRGDAFHGSEIHLQRTHLLGRIFLKTEQYNKAMTAYASMSKDASSADEEQVSAYRRWMSKHAPIHEVETKFLQRSNDLISPGKKSELLDRPTKHAALAYLPVALMLPLLLYSIIPSIIGRLVVTALIAVGAFIVAATTRIRLLMPTREWAVCGAAYVLLMAAIAGCIPQHTA